MTNFQRSTEAEAPVRRAVELVDQQVQGKDILLFFVIVSHSVPEITPAKNFVSEQFRSFILF